MLGGGKYASSTMIKAQADTSTDLPLCLSTRTCLEAPATQSFTKHAERYFSINLVNRKKKKKILDLLAKSFKSNVRKKTKVCQCLRRNGHAEWAFKELRISMWDGKYKC